MSTSCQGWIPNDHGRARLGSPVRRWSWRRFTAVATRLFSRLWLCFGPVCQRKHSSTTSVETAKLGLAMRRLRRTWHGSCASIHRPPTWQPPDAGLRRSTAWPFKRCTRLPRPWLTCLARMRTTPRTTLQGVCVQIAVRVRRRCPSTRARDCI